MTKKQQAILDHAVKTKLQNEAVLSGGSKYVNPIRKPKTEKKSKSIFKGF